MRSFRGFVSDCRSSPQCRLRWFPVESSVGPVDEECLRHEETSTRHSSLEDRSESTRSAHSESEDSISREMRRSRRETRRSDLSETNPSNQTRFSTSSRSFPVFTFTFSLLVVDRSRLDEQISRRRSSTIDPHHGSTTAVRRCQSTLDR